MELQPLPAEEDAVRRYVEELWLPYHRDLEATVSTHALDDDADLVDAELAFRLDRLERECDHTWIAADAGENERSDLTLADDGVDLCGFITTQVDEPPPVFDSPTRLIVGDIYVRRSHRGTGLARDLIDRAVEQAREVGCTELALDVDVDNEQAIAFYEKLGFEPCRHRMTVPTETVRRE